MDSVIQVATTGSVFCVLFLSFPVFVFLSHARPPSTFTWTQTDLVSCTTHFCASSSINYWQQVTRVHNLGCICNTALTSIGVRLMGIRLFISISGSGFFSSSLVPNKDCDCRWQIRFRLLLCTTKDTQENEIASPGTIRSPSRAVGRSITASYLLRTFDQSVGRKSLHIAPVCGMTSDEKLRPGLSALHLQKLHL